MSSITGGCACGAVRYECSADPIMAANCYCRDCLPQRSTGTAMASVMIVPKAALKVTGALKHYEVTGDSGNKVSRGFCPDCGSPIISIISAMESMVALKAASLRRPRAIQADDPGLYEERATVGSRPRRPAKIRQTARLGEPPITPQISSPTFQSVKSA